VVHRKRKKLTGVPYQVRLLVKGSRKGREKETFDNARDPSYPRGKQSLSLAKGSQNMQKVELRQKLLSTRGKSWREKQKGEVSPRSSRSNGEGEGEQKAE